MVCLLRVLLPLSGAMSSVLLVVSATDGDSFLRRRFVAMAFGKSFPRPLLSISESSPMLCAVCSVLSLALRSRLLWVLAPSRSLFVDDSGTSLRVVKGGQARALSEASTRLRNAGRVTWSGAQRGAASQLCPHIVIGSLVQLKPAVGSRTHTETQGSTGLVLIGDVDIRCL